jgi:hypothetical protein
VKGFGNPQDISVVGRRELRPRGKTENSGGFTRTQKRSLQTESEDDGQLTFKPPSHPNATDQRNTNLTDIPTDGAEQIPTCPPSPTKGILMTPGAGVNRRKAVSFDPAIEAEVSKPKVSRIRSGIPHDCPGKFPSPWTPKTITPRRPLSIRSGSGSLEETSLPIQPDSKLAPKRHGFLFNVDENSRIEDIMNESDDEFLDIPDNELTTDMTSPKSASGKYWKEHAENLEGLALKRVHRLKDMCSTAVEYAKRKDELCVNLGEKVRELLDKHQLLKSEIRRINETAQLTAGPDGRALSDAMRMLSEKEARITTGDAKIAQLQSLIDQYQTRLKGFEEMLNQREDKIAEMSMIMYTDNDSASMDQIAELKQKLRQARQEVKEMNSLRADNRSQRAKLSELEKEKENLEAQLQLQITNAIGVETAASSANTPSSTEALLRSQIEDLEKEKRSLKAEIRTRNNDASRERREVEKALRSEIAELKSKLLSQELDKNELERERQQLKDTISGLEKNFGQPKLRQLDYRQSTREDSPDDRRKRHRAAPLEPQQELSPSQAELVKSALKSSDAYDFALSKRYTNIASMAPANDESYDGKASTASRAEARSKSPRKSAPPIFTIKDITEPHDNTRNQSLFVLPGSTTTKETLPDIQPEAVGTLDFNFGAHEDSSMAQTPPRQPNQSFANMRRQKASPRPSIVNWDPPMRRKSVITSRKSTGSAVTKSGNMSPDRAAAAEKRLAARKAERMAMKAAAAAK